MRMTPEEAVSYIENYGWSTTRLGLGRTKELLSLLGNPEKNLKFIHVAGSNGKGSTCAMLASVLTEAGYKTGLYISPYIERFEERIQINGINISGSRLASITERVKLLADNMDDHPSQFELVTAIAIQYYYEEGCDIVVLEVGMGGALDSTNAIDSPEVAVITNIGLEHTEYLGDSLEEIARTKGGIIKKGTSCVCYNGDSTVVKTINEICDELIVPFYLTDFNLITSVSSSLEGQFFRRKEEGGDTEYFIPLLGEHQLNNAEVVLTTIDVLRMKGWDIPYSSIRDGLKRVKWPARFEVLTKEPVFILDGGHNPQCAEALITTLDEYLPGEKVIFVLGVLRDKDYDYIIRLVMPKAKEFICVTPKSERALPGDELAGYIEKIGGIATSSKSIPEAITEALNRSASSDASIVSFGSLYLAGAVRKEFLQVYKTWLRRSLKDRRNAISEDERESLSQEICKKIIESEYYQNSKTIMIYKWSFGEVRLDLLERTAIGDGKRICYPLWESGEIIPVTPNSDDAAWIERKGYLHPDPDGFDVVKPSDIDLVIVPVVGFDGDFNRLGMGGGYYDRFLPTCISAAKVGAAYGVQKIKSVPREEHDISLDYIFTD